MQRIVLLIAFLLYLVGCTESGDIPSKTRSVEFLDAWTAFPSNPSDRVVIRTVVEDKEGNIWFGSDAGVSRLKDGKFEIVYDKTNYDELQLRYGSIFVYASLMDSQGNLWFGTVDGPVVYDGKSWKNVFDNDHDMFVLTMNEDSDGNIWLGSTDEGTTVVTKFPETSVSNHFEDTECTSCNHINSLYEDTEGNHWVGSEGDLKKINGNTITSYANVDGLPENARFKSIFQSSWGNLWIGTSKGLFQNLHGDFVNVPALKDDMSVTTVTEDNAGHLWIGTQLYNLIEYDGMIMEAKNYRRNNEPLWSLINRVYRTSKGTLWVTTEMGVIKIS